MLRVSKCCFCFSLKYGFFTFAVISMLYRVCMVTLSYFIIFLLPILHGSSAYGVVAISGMIGWNVGTAVMLGIALKGIIQKRSILLYPYIVVLIVETVATIVMFLYIMCVAVAYWTLVQLLIAACVNIYASICLISLFTTFKEYEKRRPPPHILHREIIGVM